MDLFSLIPAALGALGGLFGGNNQTQTTSTPVVDPLVKSSMTNLLNRANANAARPYQAYTGDRTANPTDSRTQLNPLMAQISQKVSGGMGDANGYKARIASLMNGGPARVTVPSMVPGGASVGYQGQGPVPPIPTTGF